MYTPSRFFQRCRLNFSALFSRLLLSQISPTLLQTSQTINGSPLRNNYHFHQFQTNTSTVHHFSSTPHDKTTTDDILGALQAMEGESPQKILDFGVTALKIFDCNGKQQSLPLAMALHMMGSASCCLNRFDDGLGYLDRANRVLIKLELEGYADAADIRAVLCKVQLGLAKAKTAMGKREEALVYHRKCLELKELSLEPESKEVGAANRELAEAYVAVLNFKEALPHCLKALHIHKVQLGENSVEVANERRRLAIIYMGLGEHQKALEQNVLSQKVLKHLGLNSEIVSAEIDAANIRIALGKYDEAINTLKGVVQQTDKESITRALVYIAMANALCNMERFADSKRCLEMSSGILDKKEEESPKEVAEAYMEMALLYEVMNEFETEITLMKRSLDILEKFPQEQHEKGSASARLGWLLLLTGKALQAVPYLETAVESIKESFGSKHFGLGYVYNNLGAAYLELDKPQSAAQMFGMAKEIMDHSFGSHHDDSIDALQNLSKAYAAMGSYGLAMEFQRQVIKAWESHGLEAHDEIREAHRVLEQLRKKAHGVSPGDLSTKALPLPRMAENVSPREN